MRFLVALLICAFTAPAHADLGVGAAVGFQYTISRVAVGAEIGWAYEEVDQTLSVGAISTERATVAEGTHANVAFRFFF
ncbi:MAG TPA: hypothetical protein VLI71_07175 [Gammaproteobacteria bacterium]|nr:hypothetical protein [Gammaproteobacteria bacterium]